jgi:hypothetical protein
MTFPTFKGRVDSWRGYDCGTLTNKSSLIVKSGHVANTKRLRITRGLNVTRWSKAGSAFEVVGDDPYILM